MPMDEITILTGILAVGFALKIIGFMIRDELTLRVLVAAGLTCDVAFYGLRSEPIMQSVLANIGLVSINLVLIVMIIFERTTFRMSPDDLTLYRHFPTLTPGQFRRLRRDMQREHAPAGTPLAQEAQPISDLMLVFSKQILIEKSGQTFPIAGPAFVGEIALLTGNPSSATVTLPEGGTVVRLAIDPLKGRMAKSAALNNAMVALFGRELARKLADSVPMERAALARLGDGGAPQDPAPGVGQAGSART